MNCQQARQAMLIDPQRLAVEVNEHINGCDGCSQYLTNTRQWDTRLAHAIRQPVRENLTQRVMAAQRLQAARRRIVYAMAASVVVVMLGLALWMPRSTLNPNNEWAQLMAEHMDEDPLQNEQSDPQAQAQLVEVMAKVGAKSHGTLPLVVQAQLCPVGKEMVVHAVFEVNGERVVAFMVKGRTSRGSVQHGDWIGELQVGQGGTLGVFARSAAARQMVMDALRNGVDWQSA
jgi:anti-sigma factor RsiW